MNGLEKELEGRLVVLRIGMQTPAGRDLSARYAARVTPTFVLLDAEGKEIWRQVGSLDAERVKETLAGSGARP